ncbi:MAG: ATP-binding protein [Rhodospirillaceae bacterium]
MPDMNQFQRPTGNAATIVEDVADVDAGRLNIAPQEVDLQEAFLALRWMFIEQAERAGVTLEFTVGDGARVVWSDEQVFAAILISLVDDAIKRSSGSGKVTAMSLASSRGGVYISITDAGYRIPPDTVLSVRASCERYEHRHHQRGMQTPLLLLVQARMLMHGGSIRVASLPGGGTAVILYFPPQSVLVLW